MAATEPRPWRRVPAGIRIDVRLTPRAGLLQHVLQVSARRVDGDSAPPGDRLQRQAGRQQRRQLGLGPRELVQAHQHLALHSRLRAIEQEQNCGCGLGIRALQRVHGAADVPAAVRAREHQHTVVARAVGHPHRQRTMQLMRHALGATRAAGRQAARDDRQAQGRLHDPSPTMVRIEHAPIPINDENPRRQGLECLGQRLQPVIPGAPERARDSDVEVQDDAFDAAVRGEPRAQCIEAVCAPTRRSSRVVSKNLGPTDSEHVVDVGTGLGRGKGEVRRQQRGQRQPDHVRRIPSQRTGRGFGHEGDQAPDVGDDEPRACRRRPAARPLEIPNVRGRRRQRQGEGGHERRPSHRLVEESRGRNCAGTLEESRLRERSHEDDRKLPPLTDGGRCLDAVHATAQHDVHEHGVDVGCGRPLDSRLAGGTGSGDRVAERFQMGDEHRCGGALIIDDQNPFPCHRLRLPRRQCSDRRGRPLQVPNY